MRLAWTGVALLAATCPSPKGSTPPGKGEVVVMSASYSETSHAPGEVISKCEFEREIVTAIVEYADGAVPQGGDAPKLLTLEVQRMSGVEEDWEGDRSVILVGELTHGGDTVGTFRIKRGDPGGIMGGMSAICKGLDNVAEIMAEDIAVWLKKPKVGSEL